MKFAQRLLMTAGAMALAAILAAAVTPRAAHAVVAALVDVVNTRANPVPIDTVRHSAANFVTLSFNGSGYQEVLADGSLSSTPFTIPAGEQFVITDVHLTAACFLCGFNVGDAVSVTLGNFYLSTDTYRNHEGELFAGHADHFTSGIVVNQLPDPAIFGAIQGEFIVNSAPFTTLQGYLAP